MVDPLLYLIRVATGQLHFRVHVIEVTDQIHLDKAQTDSKSSAMALAPIFVWSKKRLAASQIGTTAGKKNDGCFILSPPKIMGLI